MKNECPICQAGNVPYVMNDLQRLINILFECTIVSTKYMHGRSNEEIAEWTAKQLRDNGFDTQPMGGKLGSVKEMTTRNLEPNGGCMYRPHALMVTSGQFWRCKHGLTSFNTCWKCMVRHPIEAFRWYFCKPRWDHND